MLPIAAAVLALWLPLSIPLGVIVGRVCRVNDQPPA